ncbi:hypothetical protein NKV53_10735 [Legionella sp. 27cVA30]|uniref:ATP-grasp domain-containing protein n=1 Tax=Legionella septentrionalis TaxID=2498109 RepID=A0A3S0X5T0_9GAMM|nr:MULTISPECIES: hypothetical protein [Legionella]MCP0914800.1 hypothetical protein [Legionella sp. 27cVA30]RUQ91066.1 hypothetical protein EKM59_00875 [Legionella septentrionalis]
MNILIFTEPDDAHAVAVQLALKSMGHAVRLIFTADQPSQQTSSISINNRQSSWKVTDPYQTIADEEYEVVWWRRARKPFVPKEMNHPDDYRFICRENLAFHEAWTRHIAPHAWWVNPKDAAAAANSKILQLKKAAQCGMSIPPTLFSNNPKDVHAFLMEHTRHGVIYKPLCANFWFDEASLKATYTTRINAAALPAEDVLRSTPGIYQRAIRKQYELRVTCFGHYIMAVKLFSQEHPKGQYDWRAIPSGEMRTEHYVLPQKLIQQIRQFMQSLGLVFGSMDFIVTEDNQYIFLEINEQGQFLWAEECNPYIPMLDVFVQFLLAKKQNFVWSPSQCKHYLMDYQHGIEQQLTEQAQKHVFLNEARLFTKLQQEAYH